MKRAVAALAVLLLVPAGPSPLCAQGPKQVKVIFEFRQSDTQSRDAVQGRGRVTPTISWFADDRSGVTEVNEASTELIVPNGRPIVIGGATAQLSELTRQILGFAASQSGSETLMTLTATVLE